MENESEIGIINNMPKTDIITIMECPPQSSNEELIKKGSFYTLKGYFLEAETYEFDVGIKITFDHISKKLSIKRKDIS